MDSTASHPPGFSHRWAPEGSPESVSSASLQRHDHVSGLGISSASSGGSVAPRPETREMEPLEGRARLQDRLVWELPKPSKGKLWTRRIETRKETGALGWGASAPEMRGLCFRCFQPGHRKRDCTNAEVCMRCWQKGHPALDCKRPRSPSTEEELRQLALAKLARRRSPERPRPGRQDGRGMRASPPPPPPPPPPQASPTPLPPPPPPVVSRLPPMEEWPPLAVEPARELFQEAGAGVVAVQPLLCVVRRSAAMCDLEQRLQLAMVVTVGGRRPAVSSEQVVAALRWCGVPDGAVSVHSFAPEDFIAVFASIELRDHVAAMPPVLVAGAPLTFRPWNRQAQLVPLKTKVELVLEGLPPHAWDTAVVEDLLGRSCAIDKVAPETKARSNLALFKLSAWTSDLEAIPVARLLAVPEPVPGGSAREVPARLATPAVRGAGQCKDGIATLQYRVLVHIARVEEVVDNEAAAVRFSESHGHGGSREFGGGPGNGGGGSGGGAYPRSVSRSFAWQRGVPDRRRGPGGTVSAFLGVSSFSATAAPAPGKTWALPGVASPAPLVQTTAAAVNPSPRAALAWSGKEGQLSSESQAGKRQECVVVVGPGMQKDPMGEKETLVGRDVAVPVTAVPTADQLEWVDAPDSLPVVADPEVGADPVPTVPGCTDPEPVASPVLAGSADGDKSLAGKVSPVPSGDSVGPESNCSAPFVQSKDKGVEGADLGACAESLEGFIRISLSGGSRHEEGPGRLSCARQSPPFFSRLESCSSSTDVEAIPTTTSFTGPNSLMQLVPRARGHELEREKGGPVGASVADREEVCTTRVQEQLELARVKNFCSSILKALAPPLLHEFEKTTGLRADAEPFTPKRVTRRSVAALAGTQTRMASAAESSLLKALGFCPENLAVREEDLRRFKEFFDSLIQDAHLRVLAAIFGKELPTSFEREAHCMRAVPAH
ncbi:hypothetical protein QYE76_055906 [Lolium multiflorum]|uniref:CCHC-type domain-containing protein n=1 Tax=Lolium multiflorum TaxID=4521 RepID=A0AAD8WMB3_LOLMU|nr:hypothetical protein QYE76_055906 [Lolium multiflorum]